MPWGFSPCTANRTIGPVLHSHAPNAPRNLAPASPPARRIFPIMVKENVFIRVITPCQLTNISASPAPTTSISVRRCRIPLSPPAPSAAAPSSASSAAVREPSPKAAAPHPPLTPVPAAPTAAAAAAVPAPWSSLVRLQPNACHLERSTPRAPARTPPNACHLERSAAESKDLRLLFVLFGEPTTRPQPHLVSGHDFSRAAKPPSPKNLSS